MDELAAIAHKTTRFWLTVNIGKPDECWPWGGYMEKGYGRYSWGGRMVSAHELALTLATGEVRAEGLETCHSCDNPPCCNPAHLRFDTRQSNVDDMTSRDRHARGERNGHAKLTDQAVETIRIRGAHGATGRDLARRYGVSQGLINGILNGTAWKHAPGPIRTQHGNTKHGTYAKDKAS